MPTITEQYRRDAETRVKELQASVDEYHELIEFLDLTGKTQSKPKAKAASKPKAKTATKSRSRKRAGTATTGRRGRKPVRSLEFVKVIEDNPGLTIREASKQIDGINETYLHRVGRELVKAGTLRKEGSRYFPGAGADVTDSNVVVIETTPVVTNEVVEATEAETTEVEVTEDETTFDPFGSDEESDIVDLTDEVDEDQDF